MELPEESAGATGRAGAAALAAPGVLRAGLGAWWRDGLLRRVFRNAGILLGGRTAAGLCALGALGLTARGLGPELFGALVLVETYVQLVGGLTKFQSWQAVIRYGARCLEQGRRAELQGLIRFTALLDLASGVLGLIIAAAAASAVGPLLGWTPEQVPMAAAYSTLLLFTILATPTGILRLFDRFDLLAAQGVVTPALRLLGVAIAFAAGAGLWTYLLVWLASGIVGRLVLVALGLRELSRRDLLRGLVGPLRGLSRPHPGLWRFVWSSNLNSSLSVVSGRIGTLAVGWALDPAAAGLYKVAREFAGGLVKPAAQLAQAVYPELAKLSAQGSGRALGRLTLRSGLIAGTAAAGVLLLLVVLGKPLLRLTVGEVFVEAYAALLLLALARAIGVYGFPLGPALFALGRPGAALQANAVTTLAYVPVVIALSAGWGLIGAGLAEILVSAALTAIMAVIVARHLARRPQAAST